MGGLDGRDHNGGSAGTGVEALFGGREGGREGCRQPWIAARSGTRCWWRRDEFTRKRKEERMVV